jgi:hypothetical protein
MKIFMKSLTVTVCALSFVAALAGAAETVGESVKHAGNTAGRNLKKAGHRIDEAVCTAGDLKCGVRKGKNRLKEGGDTLHDKGTEVKDKVD